jgi:hypothetical protein
MRGLRPHGWIVAGSLKDKVATEKVQEVIGPPGPPGVSQQLVSVADSLELTSRSAHRNVSRVGGSEGRGPAAPAKEFRHDKTAYRNRRARAPRVAHIVDCGVGVGGARRPPHACRRHTLGGSAGRQGRQAQFRRVDLRRHLHQDLEEICRRLGSAGRRDYLVVQRPPDQADDDVRRRRDDRCLAILAVFVPEFHHPGIGRAARRPARRRRIPEGLHRVGEAGRGGRRQVDGAAVLLHRVGLELLY